MNFSKNKLLSQDFDELDKCDFESIWSRELTLMCCRGAGEHLQHMFWVCKTFSGLKGICG